MIPLESVKILYEDPWILVVVKPPGMASQPERSTAMDMVSYLKNYISRKEGHKKPLCGGGSPIGPSGGRRYGIRQDTGVGVSAEPSDRRKNCKKGVSGGCVRQP